MARITLELERGQARTTPTLLNRADWVNTANETLYVCIFEDGDTVDEWPDRPDGKNFHGLPWPHDRIMPTLPGERLHVLSREDGAIVEGHEAAA